MVGFRVLVANFHWLLSFIKACIKNKTAVLILRDLYFSVKYIIYLLNFPFLRVQIKEN